jgi:hypothetical protein
MPRVWGFRGLCNFNNAGTYKPLLKRYASRNVPEDYVVPCSHHMHAAWERVYAASTALLPPRDTAQYLGV